MNAKYNEKQLNRGVRSPITYYLLPITSHRGMTLVELLVAVSIMVLLVAVSVPMFKPMLDSQKTSGAAQTVSMALQRARVRAMESNTSYGVLFDRFTDGTEPTVAIRMRLVKNATPYTKDNWRIKVRDGNIKFFQWTSGAWNPASQPPDWNANVRPGSLIQFGRQGRYYKLDESSNIKIATDSPFAGMYHPDSAEDSPADWPVEFTVKQQPRPTFVPPIIMPRGTVVDLQYSGTGTQGMEFRGDPEDSDHAHGVSVVFSPAGYLDRYYYCDNNDVWQEVIPRDPIHLCIGEWDRGISVGHADGRSNIETPSNFWVSIYPRTGEVRVTEMNPSSSVGAARKFATENFVNIGGF